MTSHGIQVHRDPYECVCLSAVNQVYAWCVLSVSVAACGPTYGVDSDADQFSDDPRVAAEIAAEIFETEHEPLRSQCMADARTAEFVPMDVGALGVQCNTVRGAAEACFYEYGEHGAKMAILTASKDSKSVHVHELLHMMLQCQANAADPDHLDAAWSYVGQPHGQHAEQRDR